MKMTDDLTAMYNHQITMELGSSVAYLQMAAYFEGKNLVGMASWMRQQAEESTVETILERVRYAGATRAPFSFSMPSSEPAAARSSSGHRPL